VKKHKLILLLFLVLFSGKVSAEPILLATHLLLNAFAVKYIPGYESTTYHGPYLGLTGGYFYERGEFLKTGSGTEGARKLSPGIDGGYQFLHTPSHKLSFEAFHKIANFQGVNEYRNRDTIDGCGIRFAFKVFALKFGYSLHTFKEVENKHDAGMYMGMGIEYSFGKVTVYLDLTDHKLEEQDTHMAGADLGIRYIFAKGLEY
jgi:hypothetical protein